MKFMIRGGETVYDAEAGVEKASLGLLYDLKVRTGIGVKTLARMVQNLSKFKDPMDILEEKDGFRALMIVIWLARQHAGEKITIEQANNVPLSDLILLSEEKEPEAAPKVTPPDSGPEGAPQAQEGQAA